MRGVRKGDTYVVRKLCIFWTMVGQSRFQGNWPKIFEILQFSALSRTVLDRFEHKHETLTTYRMER